MISVLSLLPAAHLRLTITSFPPFSVTSKATRLLAMHASCAAGITVVNIDSGFGAAMAAHRIARTLAGRR